MSLFPISASKSKVRPPAPDQRVRQIPTGSPRLVESSTFRQERLSTETWAALIDAVRRSAAARLDILHGRAGHDRMSCPWERLTSCSATCRCRGAGTVTVAFLRTHYTQLAIELALIARPSSSPLSKGRSV